MSDQDIEREKTLEHDLAVVHKFFDDSAKGLERIEDICRTTIDLAYQRGYSAALQDVDPIIEEAIDKAVEKALDERFPKGALPSGVDENGEPK